MKQDVGSATVTAKRPDQAGVVCVVLGGLVTLRAAAAVRAVAVGMASDWRPRGMLYRMDAAVLEVDLHDAPMHPAAVAPLSRQPGAFVVSPASFGAVAAFAASVSQAGLVRRAFTDPEAAAHWVRAQALLWEETDALRARRGFR